MSTDDTGGSHHGHSATPTMDENPEGERESVVQELVESVLLLPDQKISVEGELAKGGMGTVQVVVDNALQRRQARKVLHASLRRQSVPLRMFIREARITGQLDHPNIVPVHELGVDHEGRLYFSMKLVEGRTLTELIRELPAAPIEHTALLEMLDVVVKVCDALALAHSRGVVHCDVKPDNVMIGDFGEVYLMDWGIARMATDRASTGSTVGARRGTHVGTPAYMSPEHARGRLEDLDTRSDVFGVGAMLFEIIARRAPFTRPTALQAITAAAECDIPPLVAPGAPPPVPRGLLRIVERAMAKEKQARYRDARELRQALVEFVHGGGQFPATTVEADDHIVRQGEPGDAAYIIVTGRCEVYKTVNGERVVLRTMGPGDVFGETAILSPGPRTASVVAIEPTTLRKITREVFEAEVDAMKPWMGSFVRTLAARFREREDG